MGCVGEIGVVERLVGVHVWMGVVDVDGAENRTYKLGEEGGVFVFVYRVHILTRYVP